MVESDRIEYRLIRKEKVREYILATKEWCEQRHWSRLGDITNVFNENVGCANNHYIREIGRVDMEGMQYMLDSLSPHKLPYLGTEPSVKMPQACTTRNVNGRRPWKIVSGGQTGVDRAGLVAAMELGLPTGGWVPCGRLTEDGVVPAVFSTLRECPSGGFRERTRANVIDSDATLILVDALPVVGGTGYTAEFAAKNGRPCEVVVLADNGAAAQIRDWMLSLENMVRPGQTDTIVLNIAGPRESGAPGIFERAKKTLLEAFAGFRPVENSKTSR